MSMYTGVFLRFIHGVLDEFRQAEAFLFHTRLAYVSDAMKEKDPARALDRLSIMAQGAGGGTRIGESLQTFNRWHAARVIHSRSCVMIVSDGYETGDAALLGREMAALARRCRRIVWLNPMMAWPGYAPEAAGIKAALPHIDLYAPANTLKSLTELEPIWLSFEEGSHDQACRSDGTGGRTEGRRAGLRSRHRGAHRVGDRRQGLAPRPSSAWMSIVAGWIGGGCARGAVLKAAREALADGEPRMVSVQPENLLAELGVKPGENRDGVRFAQNMCPSKGTMDIFVEPILPASLAGHSRRRARRRCRWRHRRASSVITSPIAAPAADRASEPDAHVIIDGFELRYLNDARRFVVISTQGKSDEGAFEGRGRDRCRVPRLRRQPPQDGSASRRS